MGRQSWGQPQNIHSNSGSKIAAIGESNRLWQTVDEYHSATQSRSPNILVGPFTIVGKDLIKEVENMSNSGNKEVRQNPYHTYRDPETGKWIVVYPNQDSDRSNQTKSV